ncbi:MAG: globin [Planctomycetaceae bacterium]
MSAVLELSLVPMSIVDSVRASYSRCRQNADFFDAFYDHFARKSSEIGPLFSQTDMQKQNELLSEAIDSLISFAEGNPEAIRHIEEIGISHNEQHLNIKRQWYPLWVEALQDTLRESDPLCTPQLLEQWVQVIQPGVDHIVSLYESPS